jgi:cellulose synthase/poly-beta-1,6-N-acetylglucosamine synthase-like glycosyltransferase
MTTWPDLVLGAYYATLCVLAVYGLHRAVLLVRWARTRHLPNAPESSSEHWPLVTVQLPLYNERYVAERLLRAVARLDYPPDRLEIQVLDDSDDDTTLHVRRIVAELRAVGLDIHHVRREQRLGFKAGALAAGLETARGDLICIFDADFVPEADFLRRTVPFLADPGVGMVQARWDHLNRAGSLLTKAQAVLLDGHFLIEHAARHRSGCFFNFNGTAGVWRRQTIADAGGWRSDTLTEDLDLSYRAQLMGWRFVFLPDVAVPAELPADVNALKGQQHRWAMGSIQTARQLLPRVVSARLPWRVKLEALAHLTSNASYPLTVFLALLMVPAMMLRRGAEVWKLALVDLPLLAAGTVSVLAFYAASQAAAGLKGWRHLRPLPAALGLGIGLSVTNTAAVLAGLVRRGGTFHRTPKVSSAGTHQPLARGEYRAARRASTWVELALAAYFVGAVAVACRLGMWPSIPFLLLFLHGFGYFAFLGLRGATASAGVAGSRHVTPSERLPDTRRAESRFVRACAGAAAGEQAVDDHGGNGADAERLGSIRDRRIVHVEHRHLA